MDTATLPHVEPAPPGPDLPGQIAALQRKAERHKAALARLETTLATTKRHLWEKSEDAQLTKHGLTVALALLHAERVTEAEEILKELEAGLRGDLAHRRRLLSQARTRDHTLLTLRAKVSQLHGALRRVRGVIWARYEIALGTDEARVWALAIQEIDYVSHRAAGGSP